MKPLNVCILLGICLCCVASLCVHIGIDIGKSAERGKGAYQKLWESIDDLKRDGATHIQFQGDRVVVDYPSGRNISFAPIPIEKMDKLTGKLKK